MPWHSVIESVQKCAAISMHANPYADCPRCLSCMTASRLAHACCQSILVKFFVGLIGWLLIGLHPILTIEETCRRYYKRSETHTNTLLEVHESVLQANALLKVYQQSKETLTEEGASY